MTKDTPDDIFSLVTKFSFTYEQDGQEATVYYTLKPGAAENNLTIKDQRLNLRNGGTGEWVHDGRLVVLNIVGMVEHVTSELKNMEETNG